MKQRILYVLIGAMLLGMTGCAETPPPETTPQTTQVTVEATIPEPTEGPTEPLPDQNQLLEDLDALTKNSRPVGSRGEQEAAAYIAQRLSDMGYEVTTHPFTGADGKTGTTVAAACPGKDPEGDILVLAAHHDTTPGTPGANDGASGVAAMLAAAERLKDASLAPELRFLSFTAGEEGHQGSRQYLEGLPQQERERIAGCIQLDMLGGMGAGGLVLCTLDAQSNWIAQLLRDICPDMALLSRADSDHASFQLAGIPAVLLSQRGQGYLHNSSGDLASQLDTQTIGQAVELVCQALQGLTEEIPSQGQQASPVYYQSRRSLIPFGKPLSVVQSTIGQMGVPVESWEEDRDGQKVQWDSYLCQVRWFNGKNPMNSYYRYQDGLLKDILIRPAETGYTIEQVQTLLTARYGEPAVGERGLMWQDGIYGKKLELVGNDQEFAVSVGDYSLDLSNTLGTYEVRSGQAKVLDNQHAEVWTAVSQVLPKVCREKIATFRVFTDGWGGVTAYAEPIQEGPQADNSRFMLSVDYYDVYDENGSLRDPSALTVQLLCAAAQLMLEDSSQVDLGAGEDCSDPASFVEGSLRQSFYETFWAVPQGQLPPDWAQDPTAFVAQGGSGTFRQDIAQTFAVFVLGPKPEGESTADKKVALFWEDPDMVRLRQEIRSGLELA